MNPVLDLPNLPSDSVDSLTPGGSARLAAPADPFTAAARGDLGTLRHHLAQGLSPDADRGGHSLLELACAAGHERVAAALLDARARTGIALHAAVAGGHAALVALLLDRGAAPEGRDAAGFTPLLLAIAADREAIALLLLRRGADARAEVGDTGGLALARRVGNGRLVGVLKQRGARA